MIESSLQLPLKNVAVALLFSVILGPVGLLYASFWGGVFMILLGFVVACHQVLIPFVMVWVISCIWAVGAANRYNKKLLKALR